MGVIKIQDVIAPEQIISGFFGKASARALYAVWIPQLWRIET